MLPTSFLGGAVSHLSSAAGCLGLNTASPLCSHPTTAPSHPVGDLVTLVQVERHIFYHPSLPLAGTCTQLHEGRVWVNSLRLVAQSKDVVTLSPTWQCHGSFSRWCIVAGTLSPFYFCFWNIIFIIFFSITIWSPYTPSPQQSVPSDVGLVIFWKPPICFGLRGHPQWEVQVGFCNPSWSPAFSVYTKPLNYVVRPWLVWLSWLEHCPIHQKVVDLIPGQGTYLGCRFCPQSECVWEAANQSFLHQWLSLSVCLSLFPLSSLSKINKCIPGWWYKSYVVSPDES